MYNFFLQFISSSCCIGDCLEYNLFHLLFCFSSLDHFPLALFFCFTLLNHQGGKKNTLLIFVFTLSLSHFTHFTCHAFQNPCCYYSASSVKLTQQFNLFLEVEWVHSYPIIRGSHFRSTKLRELLYSFIVVVA